MIIDNKIPDVLARRPRAGSVTLFIDEDSVLSMKLDTNQVVKLTSAPPTQLILTNNTTITEVFPITTEIIQYVLNGTVGIAKAARIMLEVSQNGEDFISADPLLQTSIASYQATETAAVRLLTKWNYGRIRLENVVGEFSLEVLA